VGKPRVAAELRLRRFFQHDDLRRARLSRRHRRFEGGAAAADNHYWDILSSHGLRSPSSMKLLRRAAYQFFLYRLWMNPELSSLFMKELSISVSTRTSAIFGLSWIKSFCSRFIPSTLVCGARS
jgi:hypothetical protein